jgi:hypothetical protein
MRISRLVSSRFCRGKVRVRSMPLTSPSQFSPPVRERRAIRSSSIVEAWQQWFEVAGADLAARFLEANGVTDGRVDAVWDAIVLHTTQRVVYPVWTLVGEQEWRAYHEAHKRRLPSTVFVPHGLGIVGSALLVAWPPDRVPTWTVWLAPALPITMAAATVAYWHHCRSACPHDWTGHCYSDCWPHTGSGSH